MTGSFISWAVSQTSRVGGDFSTVVIGMILFFWILGIVWVAKDSYARIDSPMQQFGMIVLVTILGPVLGVAIYLAVRPVRYYSIDNISVDMGSICLSCDRQNNPHHRYCVFCGDEIHVVCEECSASYPASYAYCSDCGTPNLEKITIS